MTAADTIDMARQRWARGDGARLCRHNVCVDTILLAAKVILALQHIAARKTDPVDSAVVSVTLVLGDNDSDKFIPQTVKFKGTVRTLQPVVQDNVAPFLAAEDFLFMLNECPGTFVFIGDGNSAAHHHPQYNFNDDVIEFGCSYWMALIEGNMPVE